MKPRHHALALCLFLGAGERGLAAATITFLFLMSGIATLCAFFCRDHSMRMTLTAITSLLVVSGGSYSIRYLLRRPQGGAIP